MFRTRFSLAWMGLINDYTKKDPNTTWRNHLDKCARKDERWVYVALFLLFCALVYCCIVYDK